MNIGIPVVFLGVRLISHAVAPKSYGPAGGYGIFTTLVTGFMYVFGFIVAAVVGCTAGSVDLTEGMFRHLVITGRSRLALYFARIPAGLAIVIAMVAVGYIIVCAVCVFAAPTQLSYDGVNVPVGLSQPALDSWAAAHADEVICDFNFRGGPGPSQPPPNVTCGGQSIGPPPGTVIQTKGGGTVTVPAARITGADRAFAVMRGQPGLRRLPLATSWSRPTSLMVDVGLWIALEATIGFIVGLGLSSLMGQRTVAVILLIVLELILTPDLQPPHHYAPAQRRSGASSAWPWPISNRAGCRRPSAGAGAEAVVVTRSDTRVHPDGVVGDRGLARVLDRHRGVAYEDPGDACRSGQRGADRRPGSARSSSHSWRAAASSLACLPI